MFSPESGVIKSGVLQVVSFTSKFASTQRKRNNFQEISHQKVVVVVHKTSSEHFAVLYPYWGMISAKRPVCSVNLKKAKVERSNKNPDHEFRISSNRDAGILSMVFCTTEEMPEESGNNNLRVIESWMTALQGECSNDCDNETVLHHGKWCTRRRRVSKSSLLSVLDEDIEEYGI